MSAQKRGSLAVSAALDRARQAVYEAAGWQWRPGNHERYQQRWERAVGRVRALEMELAEAMERERCRR